ncbi:MAG: C39 family peptidase [Candidatus Sericytochromatia bacterium]|nr:C39 family peptidase [Candidatus Tanganyikabacteria bacterium]
MIRVLLAAAVAAAAVPNPDVDATVFWPAADLAAAADSRPERQVLVSRPQAAPFPFDEGLPSWNATAPSGTGLRVAVRVRPVPPAFPMPQFVPAIVGTPSAYALVPSVTDVAVKGEGDWSPWLNVGEWGDAPPPIPPDETLQWGGARVDVDTLELKMPATEMQWRVILHRSPAATESPALSRLAMCFTGDGATAEAKAWRAANPDPRSDWSGVREVPYKSQKSDDPRMRSSLCSPTTTYMALSYAGAAPADLEAFSKRVYDARFDLFGVWPRAVAAAAERGLPGYVSRIRSWGHLRAVLERGHLVGASIRFKKEDLKRPPGYTTSGHLTLVRGILPSGEIVTNDPAFDGGEGFAWLPEDFEKAWFRKGGVAYIFEGRAR